MLAELLDHCKAEYPHYKRIAKKKVVEYKNQYISDWKTHPKEMAMLTGIAIVTGTSLGLAYVYRQQVKQLKQGFWVEFTSDWLEAMDKNQSYLVFKIENEGLLCALMDTEGKVVRQPL